MPLLLPPFFVATDGKIFQHGSREVLYIFTITISLACIDTTSSLSPYHYHHITLPVLTPHLHCRHITSWTDTTYCATFHDDLALITLTPDCISQSQHPYFTQHITATVPSSLSFHTAYHGDSTPSPSLHIAYHSHSTSSPSLHTAYHGNNTLITLTPHCIPLFSHPACPQLVYELGVLVYSLLDYGLGEEEERDLSAPLEALIGWMTLDSGVLCRA